MFNSQTAEALIDSIGAIDGLNIESLLEAHVLPPVISIRENKHKPNDAFDANPKVPWCESGRYLQERPNFTADPLFHAGCYYVQEASSMFLEFAIKQCVDLSQAINALDLCAAPGGKSTLVANLISDESLLIANEVIQSRASILTENLSKWGQRNVWVTQNDPAQFNQLSNFFDLIMVDAPCSGSGLFRKMPGYVEEWNKDMVKMCAQRQKRILNDVYPALNNEGIFIYMTCSFCEEENEAMVDFILESFELETCQIRPPAEWGIVETQSKNKAGYGYRFFPHLLKGEGFFLACFKKGAARLDHTMGLHSSRKGSNEYDGLLAPFVDMSELSVQIQKEHLLLIPTMHLSQLHILSKHLKIIKKGILAGKLMRTELLPDHELAMYTKLLPHVPAIELTLNEALRYLKKENIELESQAKGWFLVRYHGQNLGWIKHLGNRVNNYYPSHYRILSKNILTT